jgi:eukaryotic-like serine/threonine-protein kinase
MTKIEILLPGGKWSFDDTAPLGKPGGFGEVFQGQGASGPVAIKRVRLTADTSAHRELIINRQLMKRTLQHVVPVLDAGQDANSNRYYLVMPRCGKSLQDVIDAAKGGVDGPLASNAITAIVRGLSEVRDITHRDLKPSNVLEHNGQWKIADFGIAKFVEDSTSLDTLRNALTPTYAAPEQWRNERSSTKTDIYALGCVIHALVTGSPPFSGTIDELQDQHLHATPPQLTNVSPRISGFVTQMLRKPPNSRPTLDRCLQVLAVENLTHFVGTHLDEVLAEAARKVADIKAKAESERQIVETNQRERKFLTKEANTELLGLF